MIFVIRHAKATATKGTQYGVMKFVLYKLQISKWTGNDTIFRQGALVNLKTIFFRTNDYTGPG